MPAHNDLGSVLFMRGDTEAASFEFKNACRLKPDEAIVHDNLATALHKKGDLPGAETELRRVLSLDSSDAVAHNDLGVVLLKKGEHTAAIESFKEAIRHRDGIYAQAWNNLGLARAFSGDLESSMDALLEAQLPAQKGSEAQVAMARENLHSVQTWAQLQDAQASREFRLAMAEGLRGGLLMLRPPMQYPGQAGVVEPMQSPRSGIRRMKYAFGPEPMSPVQAAMTRRNVGLSQLGMPGPLAPPFGAIPPYHLQRPMMAPFPAAAYM